jgi:hypothetical protein
MIAHLQGRVAACQRKIDGLSNELAAEREQLHVSTRQALMLKGKAEKAE